MGKAATAEQCFYCGGLVTTTGCGDHFPLPARCGGTVTVPCCDSCHDMKDRYPLTDWPVEWVAVLLQQWPEFRRETRLFLGKALFLLADAIQIKTTPPTIHPRKRR